MTLREALKDALERHDPALAGDVVDQLRFRCRMNYSQIFALAKEIKPSLTIEDWDDFMAEADEAQAAE